MKQTAKSQQCKPDCLALGQDATSGSEVISQQQHPHPSECAQHDEECMICCSNVADIHHCSLIRPVLRMPYVHDPVNPCGLHCSAFILLRPDFGADSQQTDRLWISCQQERMRAPCASQMPSRENMRAMPTRKPTIGSHAQCSQSPAHSLPGCWRATRDISSLLACGKLH